MCGLPSTLVTVRRSVSGASTRLPTLLARLRMSMLLP